MFIFGSDPYYEIEMWKVIEKLPTYHYCAILVKTLEQGKDNE